LKYWNGLVFAFAALLAILGMASEGAAAEMPHGAVYGWGYYYYRGPGKTSNGTYNTPVLMSVPADVVQVVGGSSGSTLVLKADGTVWACGNNSYGQLGNGTFTDSNVFVEVSGLNDVVQITASNHVVALKSDGTVWAWGSDYWGELGNGTFFINSNVPQQVPGLENIVQISTGVSHVLAVKSDGTVWAWGYQPYGLGNGIDTVSAVPVRVSGPDNVVQVAAGNHNLILVSDGTVWAWGNNSYGQVGDGTRSDTSPTPVPVMIPGVGPLKIVDVATGVGHSLALRSDGTVWAWGANGEGELGNGSRNFSSSPVQVLNLTNVTAVAAGYIHSLALKSDGTVWAWGDNYWSELGTGRDSRTLSYSLVPIPVETLSNVIAIPKTAAIHSFAIISCNSATHRASTSAELNSTVRSTAGYGVDRRGAQTDQVWRAFSFLATEFARATNCGQAGDW
jgi:alpha-tubulin suppressor-like RCC1 family protein